jgi:phenylpropionate dioxygenase-like ring-hydroxylating dioxygenase large terminal subunit
MDPVPLSMPSRWSRDALRALVEPDRVHRDLYLDPGLFELERERLFAGSWQFAAHASQLPRPGDYVTLELAGRSLLLLRQADGSIRGFHNRCAHKGARLLGQPSGSTGRFLRCPYHAWSYKLDGSPLARPLQAGYEGTRLDACESGRGLQELEGLRVYRDFVFVRLLAGGPDFEAWFGDALGAIDDMVDRSPVGRLRVEGGILRSEICCNWKVYLENVNDTVHPVSTHESAVRAARTVWQGHGEQDPQPMAVEQILPFGAGYDFYDAMGARVHAHGHSVLGIHFSIHSGYGMSEDYRAALEAAHGPERARQVLEHAPQNAVLYPGLALKSSPQVMRVIRPLAVDRTLVEAWVLRAEGAPDLLFERGLSYTRLVFSPMSVVAHDDIELFEGIQRALRADGNPWISLHRDSRGDDAGLYGQAINATNEVLMRNQHRAWLEAMLGGAP